MIYINIICSIFKFNFKIIILKNTSKIIQDHNNFLETELQHIYFICGFELFS